MLNTTWEYEFNEFIQYYSNESQVVNSNFKIQINELSDLLNHWQLSEPIFKETVGKKLYEKIIDITHIENKQICSINKTAERIRRELENILSKSKLNLKKATDHSENTIIPSGNIEKTKDCKYFIWKSDQIKSNYENLFYSGKITIQREGSDFSFIQDSGGAANVGYIKSQEPHAKVGVMIAANSGLPGGALGRRPHSINESDIAMATQEESVWANAVLSSCGRDPVEQAKFHNETIANQWGFDPESTSGTMTIQGIDFTSATEPSAYNGAYIVHCYLSQVDKEKSIVEGTLYPSVVVFADSVNANFAVGTKIGTMQRTLNQKAMDDYDFFKLCIFEKLRSALDAMASENVTHALVARLSCGIYAPDYFRSDINRDFYIILSNVLDEKIGPNEEKRGQLFKEVIVPLL
jgi:hypothetical protein